MSLVVVTPARNEEVFIHATIRSVERQTLRPDVYVIVDDGSTDATAEIVASHKGVHLLSKQDRGYQYRGAGVAMAVNQGVSKATELEPKWQYLCKLDADIVLPPDYFERLFSFFSKKENSRIGIVSGVVKGEKTNLEHPRGAARVYRRQCWEDIGGRLEEIHGWDTYSDLRARQYGWETRGIPEIEIIQQRPTAGRENKMETAFKVGRTMALLGYHPLVALPRSVRLYPKNPIAVSVIVLSFLIERLNYRKRILPKEYYDFVSLSQKQRVKVTLQRFLP